MLKLAAIRFAGLLACGLAGAAGATAQLSVSDSTAALTQTGETEWTLSKSGSLDSATSTVTWQVLVTQEGDVPGRLRLSGSFVLSNTGSAAAPLGNVVVNLQARAGNRWVTVASDVADATNGDAAVSASIAPKASSEGSSSFVESAASGSLTFENATSGTAFSLVPQQVVAPGASVPLSYTAQFDNGVLELPNGAQVRAELIVSFGNAASNPSATPSVDINGNGLIDADEAWVRSVAARTTLAVPAPVSSDAPTLSDTLDDITMTGTVTFSNAVFDLGATGGTVSALVDGGTDGGTISNCAHLIGEGVDLEACGAAAIEADGGSCSQGVPGCGWNTGDMRTASQTLWGTNNTAMSAFLALYFDTVYPINLVVGSGRTLTFTDAATVLSYLPASGTPGPLTSSAVNPLSTSSGTFGGEVVALKLNIDYSSLFGNTDALGDLYICNFTSVPTLNGQTISQFLTTANQVLGFASTTLSPSVTGAVARLINTAFVDGVPSTFAQNNLVKGGCP